MPEESNVGNGPFQEKNLDLDMLRGVGRKPDSIKKHKMVAIPDKCSDS